MPGSPLPQRSQLPGWATRTLRIAAVLGGTGVILGAFGAHALADRLTPDRLATFETAVRYQLIHALALIGVALVSAHRHSPALHWSARLMTVGVVIFSGTLYLLVATGLLVLGAVTPLGGLGLIGGWLALFIGVAAEPESDQSGPSL